MNQIEADACVEEEIKLPTPKIYDINIYPDKILTTVCEPVLIVDAEIAELVQNMFITMYHYGGIGLSANQCGVNKRVLVMDTTTDGSKRQAFINPVIKYREGFDRWKEGCLSFPDIFVYVKRPTKIAVSALNEKGEPFELELEGIDAICFQHELDHLNGVTFLDHLSPVQLNLIKKRLKNLKG